MKYLFTHAISGIFILMVLGSSKTEKPWVKEKEKDGIAIFLRDVEGSQIKEFKAEAKIKASVKQVVDVLLDFKSYPKWVFANKGTTQFQSKIPNEYIYYTMIESPKPTLDRDIIISLKINELTEKRCVIVTATLPNFIQQKQHVIRVTKYRGGWEIVKINDNEVLVTTICHTEPGGTVPSWVLNYMITTGPYATIKSMKELLTNKKVK